MGKAAQAGIREISVMAIIIVAVLLAVALFPGIGALANPNPQTSTGTSSLGTRTTSIASQTTSTLSGSSSTRQSTNVNITSIQLYSGTPSSPSARGTASLYMVFHTVGPSTLLLSINLGGISEAPIYQCSAQGSCSRISGLTLNANSDTSFNSELSAFYIGANISSNSTYSCTIFLSNGQKLVQTLIAS